MKYFKKFENIFFIKDFSPSFSTMFLPESRIKPLSMEVNNIIGAYESRNVLINYRGALGILSNDAKDAMGTLPVKKEDKQALQDDFLRYGLSKSQWKFIITSASVKWQQIGVPTKDLMLFEEIEDDIMRICDIYGYQYELLSSTKGVTFANKNEAKKILYQDTIIPESISICEQQTKLFGLDLLGLKLKKDFSHIPALQEDDVKKSTARLLLNQAKKIEETEKLIEKFRAKASKASMAQSLIKKLDKVERIEVDEDDNSVMNISFPVSKVPGKVVIEAET